MYAIWRALNLFEPLIRDKALWLFCDNTHSVGCLLRRSSMVREETASRPKRAPFGPVNRKLTPEEQFNALPDDIRRTMNILAREIWRKLTEMNTLLWVEYVWTKVNLADDPSRGVAPCVPGIRIGDTSFECRINP